MLVHSKEIIWQIQLCRIYQISIANRVDPDQADLGLLCLQKCQKASLCGEGPPLPDIELINEYVH